MSTTLDVRTTHALMQAVMAGTAVAHAAADHRNACGALRSPQERDALAALLASVERWKTVCEIAESVLRASEAACNAGAAPRAAGRPAA